MKYPAMMTSKEWDDHLFEGFCEEFTEDWDDISYKKREAERIIKEHGEGKIYTVIAHPKEHDDVDETNEVGTEMVSRDRFVYVLGLLHKKDLKPEDTLVGYASVCEDKNPDSDE